jgi:glutamate--cysteine ligase catalytic subunit
MTTIGTYYKHTELQGIIWMPEFCSYMLEGTPGKPYHCILNGISAVEENMKLRLL